MNNFDKSTALNIMGVVAAPSNGFEASDDIEKMRASIKKFHSIDDVCTAHKIPPQQKPKGEVSIVETINDGLLFFVPNNIGADRLSFATLMSALRKQSVRCSFQLVGSNFFSDLKEIRANLSESNSLGNTRIENLFKSLMTQAVNDNASDIHIFLEDQLGYVAFKINGQLVPKLKPRSAQAYKDMCGYIYNMYTKTSSGTGNWLPSTTCNTSFELPVDDVKTQWRFHSAPNIDSNHAHIIMRRTPDRETSSFSDISKWENYTEASAIADYKDLGFLESQALQLLEMFSAPSGAIFIGGPTGGGKSTTLNVALTSISVLRSYQKIVKLIQDVRELYPPRSLSIPVELDGSAKGKMSFSDGLNSALRSDPDIIGYGEIKEEGSGPAIVSAALTGHLVCSTFHAPRVVSSFNRLVDLGVSRSFLAEAGNVIGIVWQNLVPTLCNVCKVQIDPSDPIVKRLKDRYQDLTLDSIYIRSNDNSHCEACKGLPMRRKTLAEVLSFPTDAMCNAIKNDDSIELLKLWKERDGHDNYGVRALDHGFYYINKGVMSPYDVEDCIGRFSRGDL